MRALPAIASLSYQDLSFYQVWLWLVPALARLGINQDKLQQNMQPVLLSVSVSLYLSVLASILSLEETRLVVI